MADKYEELIKKNRQQVDEEVSDLKEKHLQFKVKTEANVNSLVEQAGDALKIAYQCAIIVNKMQATIDAMESRTKSVEAQQRDYFAVRVTKAEKSINVQAGVQAKLRQDVRAMNASIPPLIQQFNQTVQNLNQNPVNNNGCAYPNDEGDLRDYRSFITLSKWQAIVVIAGSTLTLVGGVLFASFFDRIKAMIGG
jgi:hypothetical protein